MKPFQFFPFFLLFCVATVQASSEQKKTQEKTTDDLAVLNNAFKASQYQGSPHYINQTTLKILDQYITISPAILVLLYVQPWLQTTIYPTMSSQNIASLASLNKELCTAALVKKKKKTEIKVKIFDDIANGKPTSSRSITTTSSSMLPVMLLAKKGTIVTNGKQQMHIFNKDGSYNVRAIKSKKKGTITSLATLSDSEVIIGSTKSHCKIYNFDKKSFSTIRIKANKVAPLSQRCFVYADKAGLHIYNRNNQTPTTVLPLSKSQSCTDLTNLSNNNWSAKIKDKDKTAKIYVGDTSGSQPKIVLQEQDKGATHNSLIALDDKHLVSTDGKNICVLNTETSEQESFEDEDATSLAKAEKGFMYVTASGQATLVEPSSFSGIYKTCYTDSTPQQAATIPQKNNSKSQRSRSVTF